MADGPGSGQVSSTQRVRSFLASRFDPKSQLGLGLTMSLAILALAVWALSGLLDAVRRGLGTPKRKSRDQG